MSWASILLAATLVAGCAGSRDGAPSTPEATPAATSAPTSPATETPASPGTPRPTLAPTTPVPLPDTRATRLVIPALAIDAPVAGSQVVPATAPLPAGCPPRPEGTTTLTVPAEGIATPEEAFDGLEHKSWIFGHSRWQNQPGLFFALEDISIGDELFIDGFDRTTREAVTDQRFVVEGIYLTDTDSGAELVTAESRAEIPTRPLVILQTSARERGADRSWLLDREKVLAKAGNLVDGELDDPCRYLLLFVIAGLAPTAP